MFELTLFLVVCLFHQPGWIEIGTLNLYWNIAIFSSNTWRLFFVAQEQLMSFSYLLMFRCNFEGEERTKNEPQKAGGHANANWIPYDCWGQRHFVLLLDEFVSFYHNNWSNSPILNVHKTNLPRKKSKIFLKIRFFAQQHSPKFIDETNIFNVDHFIHIRNANSIMLFGIRVSRWLLSVVLCSFVAIWNEWTAVHSAALCMYNMCVN